MKQRKIMCLLAVCSMLAGIQPVTVKAAEIKDEQTQTEAVAGDGYEIVENYETSKSVETPCFLSVETICPEGFGLNTYVILMDDEGITYRVSINSENDYVGQVYLAPGHYQVTEVSVFDDYKQKYPFVITEREFTLSENENKTVSYTMRDYEQIEAEIAEKTGSDSDTSDFQEVVISDEQFFDTGLEGITMQGSGALYYAVEHIGTGEGTMEVSGYATGAYEVVVKIVKSGVIGEAVFQISLDGGNTFIGQDVAADSCKIGDAGLTLYFKTEQDTMEFAEGDEYHVSVPETFPVIASKAGTANLIVTGHPMEEHDLVITILSSGGLGKSRFTVNSTKGSDISITDVIPENGIYEMEDDITLFFAESTAYERGLTYTATIKSNDDTVNFAPLYILLGVVVSGGAAVISVLGSRKEKDSAYRIRKYQWRKDEKEYGGCVK